MKKQKRMYGRNNTAMEDKTRCIETIFNNYNYQCQRKRGYGKGKLYCKQHDPARIKKRRAIEWTRTKAKSNNKWKQHERIRAALKLCEGISTSEFKEYKLVKRSKKK